MPKGVIWAGVSAGSNQAGVRVTCQAQTASPVGLGWGARRDTQATMHTVTTHSETVRQYSFMLMSLSPPIGPATARRSDRHNRRWYWDHSSSHMDTRSR